MSHKALDGRAPDEVYCGIPHPLVEEAACASRDLAIQRLFITSGGPTLGVHRQHVVRETDFILIASD